jgi:hypothetical protein
MRLKNNEVLNAFLRGIEATNGRNLYSEKDGDAIRLYNYSTVIAKITEDGFLLINSARYSQTTSTHQNYLRRNGGEFEELNEAQLRRIKNWKKERLTTLFE